MVDSPDDCRLWVYRAGFRFQGGGFRVEILPRKPVTDNYRQLSPNLLLLWVKVAHYYAF